MKFVKLYLSGLISKNKNQVNQILIIFNYTKTIITFNSTTDKYVDTVTVIHTNKHVI